MGAAVLHSGVFFGLPFCEIGPLLGSVLDFVLNQKGVRFKKTDAAYLHSVVFFGVPFCEVGPLLGSALDLF